MTARWVGTPGRRSPRRAAGFGLWLLLALAGGVPLAAQVGYEPGHSPYRDMPRGGVSLVTFGYLSGSRGTLGVGSSYGPTGGLRYELGLGVFGVTFDAAYAHTSRLVIDPTKDTLSRKTGPVNSDVVLAGVGLELVLTGKKTWHRLAPYIGGSVGIGFGTNEPAADTSGYRFGTKVTLAPTAGLRWYPGGRFSVRLDARMMAWRLSYPPSYKVPDMVDNHPVLATSASTTEWTWHPWGTLGLGWIF